MEAVSLQVPTYDGVRQCIPSRYLGHPPVEGRIETDDLRQVGELPSGRLQAFDFSRKVVRGQGRQLFQVFDQARGRAFRPDVVRPTVYETMPRGVQISAHFMALQPIEESFERGVVVRQIDVPVAILAGAVILNPKIASIDPDPPSSPCRTRRSVSPTA